MATTKIGIYRKYTGPVPVDSGGNQAPKSEWTSKRPFVWVARWYGVDRKRYSKTFRTRREAERFAETGQEKVRVGQGDPPKRRTLRQFIEEHAELGPATLRRTTMQMHLSTFAKFAERVGWQRQIGQIGQQHIEAFMAHRKKTMSEPTVKKELKVLKRLFNVAIERNSLAEGSNPCASIAEPKVAKTRPVYVSIDEFTAIFSKASCLLWRSLLLIYYTTGVRLSEAMHLLWEDVVLDDAAITISRHPKERFVCQWSPKDHELRTIPIPEQAVHLLRQLKLSAPDGCPYVFVDADRWAYVRSKMESGEWSGASHLINNVLRRFKTLCRKAGVKEFEIHDLRRSCITNWARSGLPIHVTQALAGHADIKTTQEYYLAVQNEDFAQARKMQEKVVSGVRNVPATDPKVTPKRQLRDFPGRKLFANPLKDAV